MEATAKVDHRGNLIMGGRPVMFDKIRRWEAFAKKQLKRLRRNKNKNGLKIESLERIYFT
jgi:hypothetical protein